MRIFLLQEVHGVAIICKKEMIPLKKKSKSKAHKNKLLWSVLALLFWLAINYFIPEPELPEIGSEVTVPSGSYLRVDYVDVGQADFILLECDGEYMTIDGGNVADKETVTSCLAARGITEIDTAVITHAHEDHCGAVSAIFDYAEVGTVYCPVTEYDTVAFKNVLDRIDRQGLEITLPVVGEVFHIGSAEVQILGPVKQYDDTNNTSIVLRVTYGDTAFLFTGDAETESENDIMAMGFDVSADVLKLGHHGSSTSNSYRWLMAVDPVYGVISSNRGDAPDYNHPHEEVVSRLRDYGINVLRTDLQGTVTCISDGKEISFTVAKNPDADTLFDAGDGSGYRN